MCLMVLGGGGVLAAEAAGEETPSGALASALATRYAPYMEWERVIDLEALLLKPVTPPYWRSAEVIRSMRVPGDGPLAGLHLALDPGHIGGKWAEIEGRRFRIGDEDFWVMEGELVLIVALELRARLEALGARVSLLRESTDPVNPRPPTDYLMEAAAKVPRPAGASFRELGDYGQALRAEALRASVIIGEIAERARRVNEVIRPDALISLHINATGWPVSEATGQPEWRLVDSNHLHVLIFGCMSAGELRSSGHRAQLAAKLTNGSGPEELLLGRSLGHALAMATGLPPSKYSGNNAIRVDAGNPYVFARNLMLLRTVECPVVLLEPYVANGAATYVRIQEALAWRAAGEPPPDDDILREYTDAVVAGVLAAYGN